MHFLFVLCRTHPAKVALREYVKITKDYTLAAAEAFQNLPSTRPDSKPFNFVFVSGEGTTHQPGLFSSLFARVKGETELALAAMRSVNPHFRVDAVRPAMVDWTAHESLSPYRPNHGLVVNSTMALLGPVVRMAWRGLASPTEPLGRFLAECAMGKWQDHFKGKGFEKVGESGFTVVSNVGFRRLAGLDA